MDAISKATDTAMGQALNKDIKAIRNPMATLQQVGILQRQAQTTGTSKDLTVKNLRLTKAFLTIKVICITKAHHRHQHKTRGITLMNKLIPEDHLNLTMVHNNRKTSFEAQGFQAGVQHHQRVTTRLRRSKIYSSQTL